MKVLLVYPKDIAEHYYAKRPVVGIAYIGTILANHNHLVELIDMRVKGCNEEYFKKRLEGFKPDVVAFSLVALGLDQAYKLIEITKANSKAYVACGGPEVTLVPSKILSRPDVDFVIVGEGEYSMLELVDAIEKGKGYDDIPGLGCKKDGKQKINMQIPIQNLDALPFPRWDLFNLKEFNKNVSRIKFPIMSSRGCPYQCMFCDSAKVNFGYRVRSPKNVADEIEYVQRKFGAAEFQFLDDNFSVYKQRVIGICNEIIKRNLKIKWVVGQGMSPSKVDLELLKKMKEAGCIVVYFGVESADDEVLRAIHKPHTVDQVKKAIKYAKEAGLIVKAPFISGLPKSTYEKERKYISFFKEMDIDMPRISTVVPFPGTEMYEWVKKNGRPRMSIDDVHEKISQTQGPLDTELFQPAFDTEDYPYEQRVKLLKEFQNETEKWILKKVFGKFLGEIFFFISRIRFVRKMGVKFMDIYYSQF